MTRLFFFENFLFLKLFFITIQTVTYYIMYLEFYRRIVNRFCSAGRLTFIAYRIAILLFHLLMCEDRT